MINKIYKVVEYLYLVMAVFFAYEAINNWSENPTRAYLFLAFVGVSIFMFFFRRNFRKKMEERNKK
ncbi:hypothetical protein [Aequorivita viscosa]|uniref:Uncharacterized protein n=1 Tax=Aequorivita viscosa TaxID=797419 RepID=A0A1M6M958_9FLAO|nr:hypothetical protein [Aequorivita viscosa]SDX28310.1 hypothetical protein SAMN05216556_12317 [Aequorivita viscosa]SHJ79900.1 hypothetical protein SAMN04487908_12617 [Aequorivita viscosa]